MDSRFRGNDELHGLREDDGLRGNDGLRGDDGPKNPIHPSLVRNRDSGCITTTGTTALLGLPDDSVDYVFTDPPFGENIYYADLNFLVEFWHRVLTNAAPEAIVDRFKGKGLPEYQRLMQRCFEEYRRVLKPGRWITIVFHNSRNAVWTAIQEALLAAGFVVADVRTMDKRQGSYRQVTSTAVKQDLVISAYKPNGGLEARFALGSTNFKELRKLPRDHPALRAKGKDRWYVPDPSKAADVEKRRTRILLREFEQYRQSSSRKLRSFRLEAMRAGFFKAYQDQDYATILSVAERIPEAVLQEDQKLLLWYDQALTRSEEGA